MKERHSPFALNRPERAGSTESAQTLDSRNFRFQISDSRKNPKRSPKRSAGTRDNRLAWCAKARPSKSVPSVWSGLRRRGVRPKRCPKQSAGNTLHFRSQISDSKHKDSDFWILDSGFWILDSGFYWLLDTEYRARKRSKRTKA